MEAPVYHQNFNPTGHLWLSAVLAALPLLALLGLLGGLRWRAHWAGLASLVVAILVAVFSYKMSIGDALNSGAYGAARSVLLVLWITFNAIWIYNMTVETGYFAVLRRTFARISDDQRVQAIVIAFCFGALIEALAGGGSPIAICAVMLIAIGFNPLKAVALALVADTAPVAFGGLGNPITILGSSTKLSADTFGAMAGRQTSILAVLIPFVLLIIADGGRGLRQAWPAALTAGVTFGVSQAVFSSLNYKLCDVYAALISAAALLLLTRVWRPRERVAADTYPGPVEQPSSLIAGGPGVGTGSPVGGSVAGGAVDDPAYVRKVGRPEGDSTGDIVRAFAPYAIIVVVFTIAQFTFSGFNVKAWLDKPTPSATFAWPGLHLLNPAGKPVNTSYVLNWLSATGTLLFISGLLTMIVLGVSVRKGIVAYGRTIRQFNWAIVTILLVFALAFVMQFSGETSTLGLFLSKAGRFFPFLAPIVGWFGVAITGTDAGSNALFASLQTTAAGQIHTSPFLLGAANTSGGVLAKMISPQNLAIGTAATEQVGQEGNLFRKVFGWSLLLLLILCILVYLQSTPVLGWMRAG
jgi:lactate permease